MEAILSITSRHTKEIKGDEAKTAIHTHTYIFMYMGEVTQRGANKIIILI